jgi:hypothetical protein
MREAFSLWWFGISVAIKGSIGGLIQPETGEESIDIAVLFGLFSPILGIR